ncbi:hypothetical protein AAFF_G00187180 [Aldrovandia affinis]|uniref:Uncharacterized protein n=1 Tax=Aldrovandia affinis TaxID=143900 RepID=A0AAD7SXY3_9TELE|nr:hypothetical protein AAFF_G00187180 [Aldrovandia affinis]
MSRGAACCLMRSGSAVRTRASGVKRGRREGAQRRRRLTRGKGPAEEQFGATASPRGNRAGLSFRSAVTVRFSPLFGRRRGQARFTLKRRGFSAAAAQGGEPSKEIPSPTSPLNAPAEARQQPDQLNPTLALIVYFRSDAMKRCYF